MVDATPGTTIGFLIYYEPNTGIGAGDAAGDADPLLPEIPDACS